MVSFRFINGFLGQCPTKKQTHVRDRAGPSGCADAWLMTSMPSPLVRSDAAREAPRRTHTNGSGYEIVTEVTTMPADEGSRMRRVSPLPRTAARP